MIAKPTSEQLDAASVNHYSQGDGPLLFYGGVFSNFAGEPLVIAAPQVWLPDDEDGLYERPYYLVEHFYQASKASTREQHDAVANEHDAWRCKRMGQMVDLRPDWDEWATVYYMLVGLRHKFHTPATAMLLEGTGERYLAEDSPTDFIWGLRSREKSKLDGRGEWKGRNLLGLCLMIVRSEIRGEELVEQMRVVVDHATSKDDTSRFIRALQKLWYRTWTREWVGV